MLGLFWGHKFYSNRVQRVVHHEGSSVKHYEVWVSPSVHLWLNFDKSARQQQHHNVAFQGKQSLVNLGDRPLDLSVFVFRGMQQDVW